jgi:AcrR family transcriptional regulator
MSHDRGVSAVGLREDKKRETRASIVDTAIELFRARGFDHTRIQDVVGHLRISEGTFFNYFPTKHAVLEEAGADLLDGVIQSLQADTTLMDLPVPDRLLATVRAFARSFEGDREIAALLAAHTGFFGAGGADRLARAHLMLADLFAQGQTAGHIRDDIAAVRLADAFLAVSTAAVHGWLGEVDPDDTLEARLVGAADVLITGCATSG